MGAHPTFLHPVGDPHRVPHVNPALPPALRALLVKVRAGLKEAGDDGAQDARRAAVPVKMGWAEVRAVYSMHTALGAAREARDTWTQKANRSARKLEDTVLQTRSDFEQVDLLNNRAVRSLFVDIERILAGDESVTASQIHDTRLRVRALLDRGRKGDHRRRVQ